MIRLYTECTGCLAADVATQIAQLTTAGVPSSDPTLQGLQGLATLLAIYIHLILMELLQFLEELIFKILIIIELKELLLLNLPQHQSVATIYILF